MHLGSLVSLDKRFPQLGQLGDIMLEGIGMRIVKVVLDVLSDLVAEVG